MALQTRNREIFKCVTFLKDTYVHIFEIFTYNIFYSYHKNFKFTDYCHILNPNIILRQVRIIKKPKSKRLPQLFVKL